MIHTLFYKTTRYKHKSPLLLPYLVVRKNDEFSRLIFVNYVKYFHREIKRRKPYGILLSQATRIGFEPTTSAVTGRRSNQLSHRAIIWPQAFCEWTLGDSNPGPTGYEPAALTNWAKGPEKEKPINGLEPLTCWLQISCSANWAISAYSLTAINIL